jgi:hypothetical protein
MHPAIHDIGIKLVTDKLEGTNQVTLSILLAIKQVIQDHVPKKNVVIAARTEI